MTYDRLLPYLPTRKNQDGPGRLAWLNRDDSGYHAQPYEQLAAHYRGLGHDEEARRVLVAKQRKRRGTVSLPGKIGSWLLDVVVGYGYRPLRAFGWLLAILTAGSIYFAANPPAPVDPEKNLNYQPVLYVADLLLPIINLGHDNAWRSAGAGQWIAAALIVCGWILATAVIAGVTRILSRT